MVYFQQLPLGLGISVTIRVGNELGAGNPLRAKRAAFTAVAIVGTISISCDVFECINEVYYLLQCLLLLQRQSFWGATDTVWVEYLQTISKSFFCSFFKA